MKQLTEKQKELAARKLCLLRGVNPDEQVAHGADPEPGCNYAPAVLLCSPAWTRAVREIEIQEQLQIALEAGRLGDP